MLNLTETALKAIHSPEVIVYKLIELHYQPADWNVAQPYLIGDICWYGNAAYEATASHTGILPTNGGYWQAIPCPLLMTDAAGPIHHADKTFLPMPFKLGTITQDSNGKISPVMLTVGNIDDERRIQRLIENHYILDQPVKVTYLLDGINDPITIDFVNMGAKVKKGQADFQLSLGFHWLLKSVPGRTVRGKFCSWQYGDINCKHNTDDGCDRTWEACRAKGNTRNFGGAPGIINQHFYF